MGIRGQIKIKLLKSSSNVVPQGDGEHGDLSSEERDILISQSQKIFQIWNDSLEERELYGLSEDMTVNNPGEWRLVSLFQWYRFNMKKIKDNPRLATYWALAVTEIFSNDEDLRHSWNLYESNIKKIKILKDLNDNVNSIKPLLNKSQKTKLWKNKNNPLLFNSTLYALVMAWEEKRYREQLEQLYNTRQFFVWGSENRNIAAFTEGLAYMKLATYGKWNLDQVNQKEYRKEVKKFINMMVSDEIMREWGKIPAFSLKDYLNQEWELELEWYRTIGKLNKLL